jgi:molecular chaperone Hsp33
LPLAAAALGRSITCCILMADGLKQEETFQVRFQGDGPLNGVLAVANGRLEARGMCGNPKVSLPPNSKGKLDVGAGVGKGNLFVVRAKMLPGDPGPSPYSSVTQIRSGEVPEDINFYLAESEQREGALAAGVHVDEEGVVDAAGGWTVQLLPGATDEAAERLMANLEAMSDKAPTTMVQSGMGPTEMLELILDGMEPEFFPSRTPVKTPNCCSYEKVMRTINLLPVREVVQVVENNEEISVKCEFCGKIRTLEKQDIQDNLERRLKEAVNTIREKEVPTVPEPEFD